MNYSNFYSDIQKVLSVCISTPVLL